MNLFYRRHHWSKNDFIILGLVLISIIFYQLFFKTFHTIKCNQYNCTVYKQSGRLGGLAQDFSFSRSEIINGRLEKLSHTVHRKHSSSTHTDYYPVLENKDGATIRLPFKFCHSSYRAENIINKILDNSVFQESDL